MARKERDYRNLKETERVWDAVELNSTQVKDYSLKNIVTVTWRINDYDNENHLNRIKIGDHQFVGRTDKISRGVHVLVEKQDEHDWLPRGEVIVDGWGGTQPMLINTKGVNFECLRDHVAQVTIGKSSAIIDLEELLKATRYA